ncbi:MAG: radical SAM protein [Acidobacteria bacterium]|nr:MAG: radical SAM protein [Acidobacteriota bacterium]
MLPAERNLVHILLHVPDNQITNNFLPQLWPFLLKNLTPSEHEVTIIDGNAVHWSEQEIIGFIRSHKVDLVGMGFMTRMAQKAYRVAGSIRAETGVPVVFGGPHVTALPEEPLGGTGQPQCADSVVIGEADELWPRVIDDCARGQLKRIYRLADGPVGKPTLDDYPTICWDKVDLTLFNLMRRVPSGIHRLLKALSVPYERAYVFPVESGRGCPYGCEFCTVTGFFGDRLRFRSNESVIRELLLIKSIAKRDKALVSVFFVDDNLAINRKRIKSLLREMIERDACLPWVGQISINLLGDEELVELIAASGARWIFVGLESMEPESLRAAGKQFNRPSEYGRTLDLLARNNVYGITSFIVGMEGDRPGISGRIAAELEAWPPGLPVFGLLTPFPATPLYDRLKQEERLTRPEHWLDFHPFETTFLPLHLSPAQAKDEVRAAWSMAYAPAAFWRTQKWMRANGKPFAQQLTLFISRLLFRGIYFPQMTRWSWFRLLARNLHTISSLILSGVRRPGRAQAPAEPAMGDEDRGWSPPY